jgi:hypothetical protein
MPVTMTVTVTFVLVVLCSLDARVSAAEAPLVPARVLALRGGGGGGRAWGRSACAQVLLDALHARPQLRESVSQRVHVPHRPLVLVLRVCHDIEAQLVQGPVQAGE